jgi:hypothetical protein
MPGARISSAVFLVSVVLSCEGDTTEPSEPGRFLFALKGLPGQFVAITSDPKVIEKARAQLQLHWTQRNLFINGPIAPGNGDHNMDWSWHFVPDEWDLVEAAIEVCDGTPQALEADLERWLSEVGRFCPYRFVCSCRVIANRNESEAKPFPELVTAARVQHVPSHRLHVLHIESEW